MASSLEIKLRWHHRHSPNSCLLDCVLRLRTASRHDLRRRTRVKRKMEQGHRGLEVIRRRGHFWTGADDQGRGAPKHDTGLCSVKTAVPSKIDDAQQRKERAFGVLNTAREGRSIFEKGRPSPPGAAYARIVRYTFKSGSKRLSTTTDRLRAAELLPSPD